MKFISKYWIHFTIILLIFPALFLNLGMMSFIEDEGTRSIVSLEMLLSGDYVTPTINGEPYLLKPPLYNWIISAFFKLSGSYSHFAMRLPAVLSLILFSLSIFLFLRKKYDLNTAFIIAIMFITCGRILFYDSTKGLIDITFSWLVFLMFMAVYHFMKRKKYYLLFITVYFVSACGYLMKGLPAIAFLGITLFVSFLYTKKFKKLFSLAHITGFLCFVLMVGGYYFIYLKRNPGSFKNIITILFNEVGKKTVENDTTSFARHLILFWVDYLVSFLPWTVLILALFKKEVFKKIFSDDFLKFLIIIFCANILIYWLSPKVYPRYLIMFLPLTFTVLFIAFDKYITKEHWMYLFFRLAFSGGMLFIVLSPIVFLFIKRLYIVDNFVLKCIILFLMALPLAIQFFIKYEKRRNLLLVLAGMFIVRISFNTVIFHIRHIESWNIRSEVEATKIGKLTKGEPLYIHDKPSIFHEEDKLLRDLSIFYLTRERGEIVPKDTTLTKNGYYIVYPKYIKNLKKKYIKIDEMYGEETLTYWLVKFKED